MAFAANAYSNYFRAIQSPVCAVFGPTGPPGGGSTGPTGSTGPAGTNGISTGLVYYFHAQSVGGQPNDGDTGFAMNTSIQPGPAGGNPVYLPTVYNGYFSEIHPTAGTSGPALLGDFKTSAGDPGVTVIPAGSWTFLMNIYTGVDYTGSGNTGITGSAGTSINVYAELWKTSQGVSSLIGDNKTRSIVVNSASDDQLYSMGVTVQTAQTLFTPLVDSMFVRFYAVPTTSTFVANQRIEFWTDGDSVSQVTTTLPSKNGNSGPVGPQGPQGEPGLPGTPGAAGSQGIQGPMGQSTWTPVLADSTQITQSATTSGVFTKTGGTNALWDSAVRSAQAYSAGAYVSFDTPSTLSEVVIGLSDAPSINTIPPVSLNVITYGINYNVNGTSFYFIESGVSIGPDACAVGDRFSIIYDGTNVIYYQNGVVKRTVARAIGLPLHLESNFFNIGSTTSNLVFGPASPSGVPFVGDLAPGSVSQRFGPLFYDRTNLNQVTSGPYYWSYVFNQYSQAINCTIAANGMPNGMLVINWSLYNRDPANYPPGQLPSAMVVPEYSPIPGDVYATPWTYEPPQLSMLAGYDPIAGIYSSFSPKITGLYMINISINSDMNGIAQGGTLAFIDSDGSRNLSNMISPRPWQNTTSFIATLFYGKSYVLCGGGHGALNIGLTVFAGTQIQFYLLSPL